MGHSHAHHHGHCSHHASDNIGRLRWVLILTGLYMIVEFIGGFWANSLALLADAGHMLTDVGAIGLALFAAWFSEHPASSQNTFGYYRVEIFAAMINGIVLALISLVIFYEALQRFQNPPPVEGAVMLWISVGGLIVNLISAYILHNRMQQNINVKGAYAHVVSDCLGSLGAILAGISIIFFQFKLADPLFSILIGILVLYNAWKLIWEAANVLLEASPVHLNVDDIKQALIDIPEIKTLHDLHVWCITSGKEAMSVHVVVEDEAHYKPELVTKIQHVLKEKFGLTHLTIQLETPDFEEDDIHF